MKKSYHGADKYYCLTGHIKPVVREFDTSAPWQTHVPKDTGRGNAHCGGWRFEGIGHNAGDFWKVPASEIALNAFFSKAVITSIKLRCKISGPRDVALSYLFVLLFSVCAVSRLEVKSDQEGSQECERHFTYCGNVCYNYLNSHNPILHLRDRHVINCVFILPGQGWLSVCFLM